MLNIGRYPRHNARGYEGRYCELAALLLAALSWLHCNWLHAICSMGDGDPGRLAYGHPMPKVEGATEQ